MDPNAEGALAVPRVPVYLRSEAALRRTRPPGPGMNDEGNPLHREYRRLIDRAADLGLTEARGLTPREQSGRLAASGRLRPEDLAAFRAWFAKFDAEVWDRELEDDIPAGRLDALAEEALDDLRGGRCTDL